MTRGGRVARYGLPVLIALLVFACFLPVLSNNFVNWDDPFYFKEHPHYRDPLLLRLRWMFTTFHMSHYQPLVWVVHDLVRVFGGLSPFYYHGVNLVLHAMNAVLLYYLIVALVRRGAGLDATRDRLAVRLAAAAGALFFAIHPLRVEAVAWAVELGEVLCGFFYLLTVLTYLEAQDAKAVSRARRTWYVLSVACFALALLSRATAVTLPAVLLALDFYPLRRGASRNRTLAAWVPILAEKIPYFLLSVGAGTLLILAKRPKSMVTLLEHGIVARAMQAGYGLCFYLWKTVAPLALSPLYLLNKAMNPLAPVYLLCATAAVGITVTLILMRRRWPWALTAWGCYVVTLLPLLGLMQSGLQVTADRYSYFACLPWATLAAAGVYQLWRAWKAGRIGHAVWFSAVATLGVALLALGLATRAQTHIWKNSIALWSHAIALDRTNYFAYATRGGARQERGDLDGALADYDVALGLSPLYDNAYDSRGTAREAKGDVNGALADYASALLVNPRFATAYYHRGNMRRSQGDLDGALADYVETIRFDPEHAAAFNGRGRVRHAKGDLDGALADYDQAVRLDPRFANAYNNRGTVRRAKGDLEGAVDDFTRAVQLVPSDAPHRAVYERNLTAARQRLAAGPDNR